MAPTETKSPSFTFESFGDFFEQWLTEQDQFLQELNSAADSYSEQPQSFDSFQLRQLVNRVILHYDHYYRIKSCSVKHDVLAIMNPAWLSSLEDAFLWIGGWRPTVAFHLLYSKAGLQFEARLDELLRGVGTGDLGDLSPTQLKRVDRSHRETIEEEKQITEEMAAHQETIADTSMVRLCHVLSELTREEQENQGGGGDGGEAVDERVGTTLQPKESGLVRILLKADGLRLKTLKKIVDILRPIQAVYFLIAAAELLLRIHEWGKKKDALQHSGSDTGR